MTVHKRYNGGIDLMVSQPGGAYVTLLPSGHTSKDTEKGTDASAASQASRYLYTV